MAAPEGMLDDRESAEAAAVREVREETGLGAKILSPLGRVEWQYEYEGSTYIKQVDFFAMEADFEDPRGIIDEVVRGAAIVAVGLVADLLAFDSEREIALLGIELLAR